MPVKSNNDIYISKGASYSIQKFGLGLDVSHQYKKDKIFFSS